MTDGRRTYGILGDPVGHSLSPAMHRAAFREMGIDAEYVPFQVGPAELPEAVAGLRALPVAGLNVTVPHKEAILPLLDEVSDEARRLRAANTIVVRDGRWRGENTDAPGTREALRTLHVDLEGADAVIVGAGGAARAALAALAALGVRRVHVANRTSSRARALVALARERGVDLTTSALDVTRVGAALRGARVLVQATSAGMRGVDAGDWPAPIPLEELPRGAAVVDLVYEPRPTELLRRAAARGHETQDGLETLLHQGALSFTLWTGLAAPRQAMRRALEESVRDVPRI